MSDQCKALVSRDTWHEYPCSRKAVRDGWCGQHHPDAEAARLIYDDLHGRLADVRF